VPKITNIGLGFSKLYSIAYIFHPRDAMRKRGLRCRKMVVCLSARLSHASIVSKRLNLS